MEFSWDPVGRLAFSEGLRLAVVDMAVAMETATQELVALEDIQALSTDTKEVTREQGDFTEVNKDFMGVNRDFMEDHRDFLAANMGCMADRTDFTGGSMEDYMEGLMDRMEEIRIISLETAMQVALETMVADIQINCSHQQSRTCKGRKLKSQRNRNTKITLLKYWCKPSNIIVKTLFEKSRLKNHLYQALSDSPNSIPKLSQTRRYKKNKLENSPIVVMTMME